MLTPKQEKLIKIAEKYESLKTEMKELKPQLLELLEEVGVGAYFQNPENDVVYKVKKPTGTYISFDTIGYDRTKKIEEKKGSLSKKEAVDNGFEV